LACSAVTVAASRSAVSDHPEFAEFLVHCGIDSMSVSPDSFIAVKERFAAAETNKALRRA
jgi:pyruvate,water dikinase